MTILEEVKKMQQQGLPENQIVQSLREKGSSYKDISEALSQSKIKAAVEDQSQAQSPMHSQTQGMQQSIMPSQELPPPAQSPTPPAQTATPAPAPSAPTPAQTPQTPAPQQQEQPALEAPQPGSPSMSTQDYAAYDQSQYYSQDPNQQYYDDYSYDSSSAGISSDTIAEISEQVVSENLSSLRKQLETILDFRTTIETKTESLNERLKRIENTIDILQSSVLRKIGDYTTNIEDIKNELITTQKTFSKLAGKKKKSS